MHCFHMFSTVLYYRMCGTCGHCCGGNGGRDAASPTCSLAEFRYLVDRVPASV